MEEAPHLDWESPEFGAAIRTILDTHEKNAYGVSAEAQSRLRDVVALAHSQPELFVSASFALLNAAISLPQLVPAPLSDVPEIRLKLETKAYEDISQMDQ